MQGRSASTTCSRCPSAEVEERLSETGQDVVLVPLGSTEKHGAHIPLGTDSYVTMEVVKRVGVAADVLYRPLVPFGYSPHHMGRHLEGAGTSPCRRRPTGGS